MIHQTETLIIEKTHLKTSESKHHQFVNAVLIMADLTAANQQTKLILSFETLIDAPNHFLTDMILALSPYICRPISPSAFRDVDEVIDVIDPKVIKELRKQVSYQLSKKLKDALLAADEKRKDRVHKEIDIFKNLIQIKYFEALKEHSNVTVDLIRLNICRTLQNYLRLKTEIPANEDEIYPPSSFLPSCLVFVLRSSPFKSLKILFLSERLDLVVAVVQVNYIFICAAIRMYGVNRKTLRNRVDDKST